MKTRFGRKQTAQPLFGSGEIYTELALKTFTGSLEVSQHCRIYLADREHGQVHNFSGNNYVGFTKPKCAYIRAGDFQERCTLWTCRSMFKDVELGFTRPYSGVLHHRALLVYIRKERLPAFH